MAALIAICIYLKQRNRKLLSYSVLTNSRLLSIRNEIKGKIKIMYQSKEVENVNLVEIKIFNSGNVPIEEKDIKEPISIFYGKNSQILSTEVSEVEPVNLDISLDNKDSLVELSKVLINSGDSITIKALVSRMSKIFVNGRIVGVKEIKEYIPKLKDFNFGFLVTFVISMLFYISGYLLLFFLPEMINVAIFLFGIALIFMMLLITYFITAILKFYYRKFSRKKSAL